MFTLVNTVGGSCSNEKIDVYTSVDKAALAVDFFVIAGLATLICLTVLGKMDVGIPGPLGTINNNWVQAMLWASGAFLILDAIVIGAKLRKEKVQNPSISKQMDRNEILKAKGCNPTLKEKRQARGKAYHQVMGSIYLGTGQALVESTDFNDMSFTVNNPAKFTTIITVCPLTALKRDMFFDGALNDKTEDQFMKALKANGITDWLYIGKITPDMAEGWGALVYDCTHLSGSLAEERDLTNAASTCLKKTTAIELTPMDQWFQPIFLKLDKGLANEDKIVIHCQEGISRSATVLAAYLINRFKLTAAEAIDFLKSKRACVEPKFEAFLKGYATSLSLSPEQRMAKFKQIVIEELENNVKELEAQLKKSSFQKDKIENQLNGIKAEINRLKGS